MPVGRPDWYVTGQSNVIETDFDTGELAARLGSCVNYDRSNKVIYLDNFTRLDSLYQITNVGVGVPLAINTNYAIYGGSSVSAQINLGAANNLQIYRPVRLWEDSRLSFEVAILWDQIPSVFNMTFYYSLGNLTYEPMIQIITGGTVLQVRDSLGLWHTLETFGTSIFTSSLWLTMKLQVDTENHDYISFRLNENYYDPSAYGYTTTPIVRPNQTLPYLRVWGNAGAALTFWLDHWLVAEDY